MTQQEKINYLNSKVKLYEYRMSKVTNDTLYFKFKGVLEFVNKQLNTLQQPTKKVA